MREWRFTDYDLLFTICGSGFGSRVWGEGITFWVLGCRLVFNPWVWEESQTVVGFWRARCGHIFHEVVWKIFAHFQLAA